MAHDEAKSSSGSRTRRACVSAARCGRRLDEQIRTGASSFAPANDATNPRGKIAAVATMLLALAGCIGINPRWDEPVDESIADDGDTTGERGATGGTDGGSTESGIPQLDDGAGAESSTTESSTTESSTTESSTTESSMVDEAGGESSSGESTGAPAPACAGMEIVCDGECHDVASDKRACGLDCIDCTELFGPAAKCVQGVCDDNGGGNDDGDGDD